jgi:nicotinamide mononucleotide transporter
VPYTDALTTSLSVIALWMLSRKLIEQWWVWFVVDLISSGLYIYKGIYGRALLYGIYTVMAVYGFLTWKRKMRQA